MALGFNDLKNLLRVPGLIDLEYLRKFNGIDGTSINFEALARDTATAFNAFNNRLTSGYYAQYLRRTTDLTVNYGGAGGSDEMPLLAEYALNDPNRAAEDASHMLPMFDRGEKIGFTYFAIRRGNQAGLDRAIRGTLDRAQNSWDRDLLRRLFSGDVVSVGSGKSRPFADGGTADPNYAPPNYGGNAFTSGHTHFFRYPDTPQGRADYLNAAAATLREHGLNGPFELVIPDTDVSAWRGLTESATPSAVFIKPVRNAIDFQSIQARVTLDDSVYIGAIETERAVFNVKTESRLASKYAGVFKPKGLDAIDNVLAVRYEAGYPLGLTLVQTSPQYFPLQDADVLFTYGFGVDSPLAGALGYFAASGGYPSGTGMIL